MGKFKIDVMYVIPGVEVCRSKRGERALQATMTDQQHHQTGRQSYSDDDADGNGDVNVSRSASGVWIRRSGSRLDFLAKDEEHVQRLRAHRRIAVRVDNRNGRIIHFTMVIFRQLELRLFRLVAQRLVEILIKNQC